MNNLKIGVRLGGGFGLILSLMAIVVVIGVVQLTHISSIVGNFVQADWTKEQKMSVISTTARDNNSLTLEMFIAPDEADLERIRQTIGNNKKTISAALEVLDQLVTRPEARNLLAKMKASRATYVASFSKVDQLVASGKRDAAVALMLSETTPALNVFMGDVNKLELFLKGVVSSNGNDVKQTVDVTSNVMIIIGIAAMIIGIYFAYVVSRSITRPIIEAVKIAETVAAGDLSSHIEVKSTDETGQLITALKQMNENLVTIVTRVRTGTDTIATASNQIASSNLDLSARTEEQASALEQTAASMEELTSTTKHNSDNARQANQLAQSASKIAQKGGEVVSQVITTMGSINESAAKIANIIGVVESIAFQTNILALNAAVESAHAGEHGRGFSVVATEVRNLAQRSSAAAKEINVLINDSVQRVGAGTKLVMQAGTTMDEVVASVTRVSDIIADITRAGIEQSSGIEQINQAIIQMDQVTQQNAALVEETAAAAQMMEDQSRDLVDAVSIWTVATPHATVAPAPFSTAIRPDKVSVKLATLRTTTHVNVRPIGYLANSLTGKASTSGASSTEARKRYS